MDQSRASKQLTALRRAVAAIPAQRRLHVFNTPQLTAEPFHCFLGHPRLVELWADTGRPRVNEAVKRMFSGIAR